MLSLIKRSFALSGFATAEGTLGYSKRNSKAHQLHFRKTFKSSLTLSSTGIGTYVGAPDEETDILVEDAVYNSVKSGCVNVIDTAINYRYQKAERSVGRALDKLVQEGFTRQEIFLASKIGYVPVKPR
jgi:aryl-alcohol dehydrogenase-like predicted oxidoreductase